MAQPPALTALAAIPETLQFLASMPAWVIPFHNARQKPQERPGTTQRLPRECLYGQFPYGPPWRFVLVGGVIGWLVWKPRPVTMARVFQFCNTPAQLFQFGA